MADILVLATGFTCRIYLLAWILIYEASPNLRSASDCTQEKDLGSLTSSQLLTVKDSKKVTGDNVLWTMLKWNNRDLTTKKIAYDLKNHMSQLSRANSGTSYISAKNLLSPSWQGNILMSFMIRAPGIT
jgi:hypothetical protein